MSQNETAQDLVQRWQSGDEQAAEELYRRYADRLCDLARAQISRRLDRRFDAEDVMQSVFRTFFRRTRDGQYPIDRSGNLWHLLVTITLNKVRRKAKFHRQQKRNVGAEVYAEVGKFLPGVLADAPQADSAHTLILELDELLNGLDDSDRRIVQLCLQGFSTTEIGKQLGCTRWTVRRTLDRVGQRLRKRLQEEAGERPPSGG